MPTSETVNLERLDALEAKVSQAARAVETLTGFFLPVASVIVIIKLTSGLLVSIV